MHTKINGNIEEALTINDVLKAHHIGICEVLTDTYIKWANRVFKNDNTAEQEIEALYKLRKDGVLFFDTPEEAAGKDLNTTYYLAPIKQPFYCLQNHPIARIGINTAIRDRDGYPLFINADNAVTSEAIYNYTPIYKSEEDDHKTFGVWIDLGLGTINTAYATSLEDAEADLFIFRDKYEAFIQEITGKLAPIDVEEAKKYLLFCLPLLRPITPELLTVNKFLQIVGKYNKKLLSRDTADFIEKYFPYEDSEQAPELKILAPFYNFEEINRLAEEQRKTRTPSFPMKEHVNTPLFNDPFTNDMEKNQKALTIGTTRSVLLAKKGTKLNRAKTSRNLNGAYQLYTINENGEETTAGNENVYLGPEYKQIASAVQHYWETVGDKPVPLKAFYRTMINDPSAKFTKQQEDRLINAIAKLNGLGISIVADRFTEQGRFEEGRFDSDKGYKSRGQIINCELFRMDSESDWNIRIFSGVVQARFIEDYGYKGGYISRTPAEPPNKLIAIPRTERTNALNAYAESLKFYFHKNLKPGKSESIKIKTICEHCCIDYEKSNNKKYLRDTIEKVFTKYIPECSIEWVKNQFSSAHEITEIRFTKKKKTEQKGL